MKKRLLLGTAILLSSALMACSKNEVQPTPEPMPAPEVDIKPTEERPENPEIRFVSLGRYSEFLTNLDKEGRRIELELPTMEVYLDNIVFEINYSGTIERSYYVNDNKTNGKIILKRGLNEVKIKLKAKYNEEEWIVVINNTTPDVVGIELIDYDLRIPFYIGDDLSRLKLKVTVNDEESIVPVTEDMITGFSTDAASVDYTEFKITYLGKTITRSYHVCERPIHISTADIKKTYIVGDERLEGTIRYSTEKYSNTNFILRGEDVEGFDTSTPGEKTVKIRFKQEILEVKITVYEATSSVEVTSFKDVYFKDSSYVNGRLRVTKNGKVEYVDLTSDMVTGLDLAHEGLQEVTIKYNDTEIKRTVLVLAKADSGLNLPEPDKLDDNNVRSLLASIKALNSINRNGNSDFNALAESIKATLTQKEVDALKIVLLNSAISNKNIEDLISYISTDALVVSKYLKENPLANLKLANKDELAIIKGSARRLLNILTYDQWVSLILVNKTNTIEANVGSLSIYDKATKSMVDKALDEVLSLISLGDYDLKLGGEYSYKTTLSEAREIFSYIYTLSGAFDSMDNDNLYNLLHLKEADNTSRLEAIHMLGNIIEASFDNTAINDALSKAILHTLEINSNGNEDKLENAILIKENLDYFNKHAKKISEILLKLDIYTLDSFVNLVENRNKLANPSDALKYDLHVVLLFIDKNINGILNIEKLSSLLDRYIPNAYYYLNSIRDFTSANYLDANYNPDKVLKEFVKNDNELIIADQWRVGEKIREKYGVEGIWIDNIDNKPGFGYARIGKEGYYTKTIPYYIYDNTNSYLINDGSSLNLLKDYFIIDSNYSSLRYAPISNAISNTMVETSSLYSLLRTFTFKVYIPEIDRYIEVSLDNLRYDISIIKAKESDINPSLLKVSTEYGDIDFVINLIDDSKKLITSYELESEFVAQNRGFRLKYVSNYWEARELYVSSNNYDLNTLGRRTIHINDNGYEFDIEVKVLTIDQAYFIKEVKSLDRGVNPR